MRELTLALVIHVALVGQAFAWGQEGHSIVGEIAQTRLSGPAAETVRKLLNGRSLASVSNWSGSPASRLARHVGVNRQNFATAISDHSKIPVRIHSVHLELR
jgi:hypothetical protein